MGLETGVLMAAVVKSHIRVVLADDHPVVRDGLAAMVNQQADMELVAEGGDGEGGIVARSSKRPQGRLAQHLGVRFLHRCVTAASSGLQPASVQNDEPAAAV